MTLPAGQAAAAAPPVRQIRRETPLLPASSIAGRSLVIVIAIMTFLASLTAGAVELIAGASANWRASVSREVTIQIRPRANRDIEADVQRAAALARAADGVASVRPYSRAESSKLLEPWLGSGLDLQDLPVPRLIIVRISGTPDYAALRASLAAEVPGASLDDHRQWIARLAAMANTLVLAGVVMLGLVLTATGLAVAFATRGAMTGSREIINVLNLVGATDGFIATQFQHHFLRLSLRGGAIGGLAALAAFFIAGTLSSSFASAPGADQIEALFGAFSLGLRGYGAVIAIAGLVAATCTIVSRLTVFRNLRGHE